MSPSATSVPASDTPPPRDFAQTVRAASVLAVVAALAVPGFIVFATTVRGLNAQDERGYGDSTILYDTLAQRRSGRLYRDLSEPPYTPTLYSPLFYSTLARAVDAASADNPFLGPRVTVVGAYLGCLVLVSSIARVLVPERISIAIALALTFGIHVTWSWLLQVRPDFIAAFLGLAALRLSLVRRPSSWLWSLIAAAAALQWKITAGGSLAGCWLVEFAARRWARLIVQVAAGVSFAAFGYVAWSLREPRMWPQLFALREAVVDVRGALELLLVVAFEPVVWLAVCAVVLTRPRTEDQRTVALFAGGSGVAAAATSLQAGANTNYFLEALFMAVPLAVVGVLRLRDRASRSATVALACALLCVPPLVLLAQDATARVSGASLSRAPDEVIRKLTSWLEGQRVLSTVPRLALVDPRPAVIDPYLLSYIAVHRPGVLEPVVAPVWAQAFDVVITPVGPKEWRGVPHIHPALRSAIASAYRPHCRFPEWLVHLPVGEATAMSEKVRELERLGCDNEAVALGVEW
jgi:hypothetical protein